MVSSLFVEMNLGYVLTENRMVAGVDLFDDSYSSKLYVIIDADMCVDVQLESFDKKILRKTTLVLYSQYLGES